jgi:hypothetical protein
MHLNETCTEPLELLANENESIVAGWGEDERGLQGWFPCSPECSCRIAEPRLDKRGRSQGGKAADIHVFSCGLVHAGQWRIRGSHDTRSDGLDRPSTFRSQISTMASNLHLSCLPKLMLALSDGQTRFARPDKAAASKREPCHGFLVADHFAHQATRS